MCVCVCGTVNYYQLLTLRIHFLHNRNKYFTYGRRTTVSAGGTKNVYCLCIRNTIIK